PALLNRNNISADQIIGIGIDFTACTMMCVDNKGTPLCFKEEFSNNPHAYVKLWKHHAAQKQADRINQTAREMGFKWLDRYGGKISSEWFFPKILETLENAYDVYEHTYRFIEAGDWVVWMLTGNETHNACMAGYKAMWHKQDGYPSKEFFKALDIRMENIIGTKVADNVLPMGAKAGGLSRYGSSITSCKQGTAVAVSNVDAHVAMPAAGITQPDKMLMIMGTSTCHMVLGEQEKPVKGICGVVEDGIIEGFYGYEAGQSCVGDHFDWFVKNCVPDEYLSVAKQRNISIHKHLREQAIRQKPGESGLLALDWWNGNRSILVDADLTGVIIGMTLATKPHEIYRALIEATAYGTKMIIDNFESNGVKIEEIYAAGGIADKDEMMMQIYADVTKRKIHLSGSPQAPALGSAIFAAVAGGYFNSISEAAEALGKVRELYYEPIPENSAIYDKLYNEYAILHDYFGRGTNDVLKRLKSIKAN
ncbi:MAG: ribulokinase, partial [Clostridia bacterium]